MVKPRTPEELASEKDKTRDKFTLYLNTASMSYLQTRANKAGTSVSKLVDEAITAYIHQIKDRKSD